jgi:outer membrane lipoprotein SlyB
MENNNTSKRIHPLVAGAAVSVMLVSLTGMAALTGLIPSSHGSGAASTPVAPIASTAAPALATAATSPSMLVEPKSETNAANTLNNSQYRSVTEPVRPHAAPQIAENAPPSSRPSYRANPQPAAPAPSICYTCGSIESVQAIRQQAQPSGVGMVAGAVLGGILGNQVGGGSGRKIATVAGAVGGGYAGNEVEKRTRGTTSYQVRVRMEDGKLRTFNYSQQPGWAVGEPVRVVNGKLTSRA